MTDPTKEEVEAGGLAIINSHRVFHGLDAITWDFRALRTDNRENALRQAEACLIAAAKVRAQFAPPPPSEERNREVLAEELMKVGICETDLTRSAGNLGKVLRASSAAALAAMRRVASPPEMTRCQYDQHLGEITAADRANAADLIDDLAIEFQASGRLETVAEWFRKARYEAVMGERRVATKGREVVQPVADDGWRPSEEDIARAIYDVASKWIAPNFNGLGIKPTTFEDVPQRDRTLHFDYARAVLALFDERRNDVIEECAKVAGQEPTAGQIEQLETGIGAILTLLMAYEFGRHSAAAAIRAKKSPPTAQGHEKDSTNG